MSTYKKICFHGEIGNMGKLVKYVWLKKTKLIRAKEVDINAHAHTVNPRSCYNDSICSQRCCHYNEFAVVKNP